MPCGIKISYPLIYIKVRMYVSGWFFEKNNFYYNIIAFFQDIDFIVDAAAEFTFPARALNLFQDAAAGGTAVCSFHHSHGSPADHVIVATPKSTT